MKYHIVKVLKDLNYNIPDFEYQIRNEFDIVLGVVYDQYLALMLKSIFEGG